MSHLNNLHALWINLDNLWANLPGQQLARNVFSGHHGGRLSFRKLNYNLIPDSGAPQLLGSPSHHRHLGVPIAPAYITDWSGHINLTLATQLARLQSPPFGIAFAFATVTVNVTGAGCDCDCDRGAATQKWQPPQQNVHK